VASRCTSATTVVEAEVECRSDGEDGATRPEVDLRSGNDGIRSTGSSAPTGFGVDGAVISGLVSKR